MKKRLTNLYQRNKVIINILIIIVAFIITIIICGKIIKNTDNKNQSIMQNTSIDVLFQDTVKSNNFIELPTIESPDDSEPVSKGNNEYINYAVGYRVYVPEGFELYNINSTLYFINKDSDTEVILKVTDNVYETSLSVWEDAINYTYRFSYLHNGKYYNISNYGADSKETVQVGDFSDVRKESIEIWYKDNEDTPKINAYYTTINAGMTNIEDELSEKKYYNGLIMLGSSTNKNNDSVFKIMDNILETIKPYIPTKEERGHFGKFTVYTSDKGDYTEIEIPSDWTIDTNEDGMVTFTAPDNSIYKNVKIQFMADSTGNIVNDYAQFSEAYERQILNTLFTQDVGETGYDYDTVISKIKIDGKIRNKDSIIFKIHDTISLNSNASRYSLSNDSCDYYSTRYTYKVGNVQCMLNFLYTNEEYANDVIKAVIDRVSIK